MGLNNSLKITLEMSFTPRKIWCDNKAAIANAKTGEGANLRHKAERRKDYLKECVDENWIYIRWVNTKE